MHRLRTAYLCCLIALALAPRLCAQAVPAVGRVLISRQASSVLDSLASTSRDERVEIAACLVNYAVRDSVLLIERIGPAVYAKADSLTVYVDTTKSFVMCPAGTPTLHSHVAANALARPSDIDRETGAWRGMWSLLLLVRDAGWVVVVY